jgi:probable F420-dependent oxidoreductase
VKFSVTLPTDRVDQPDEFVTGDAVAELAATIERLGLDACCVTDHPAPDSRWLDGGGHHALEPTVALSFAAAATRRIHVHTHVYVVAYRNPFLAAKALGSLDVLSGGRLVVGIGPGYLRAEFAALGVDFDTRVAATDATVELLRRLWAGEVVVGEDLVETPSAWKARGVLQLPTPERQPTLWFGGNSRRSMERAIAMGQGWSPFPTVAQVAATARTASISDAAELEAKMVEFHVRCEEVERTEPIDVCFGAFGLQDYLDDPSRAQQLLEEYSAMSDLGVTWSVVGFPGRDRVEVVDRMERFAEEIAAPLRG